MSLRLFHILPIFFSSQLKRSVVISNNDGMHELPHEFPNDLRLETLEPYEITKYHKNFETS